MKLSEIGITIGYVLVILGFFYFIGLALNTKEIVENFESKNDDVPPGKMAELIEDLNTSLKDDLNIGKNRAAYQDALSQMHENVNLSMLKLFLIPKAQFLTMMNCRKYKILDNTEIL